MKREDLFLAIGEVEESRLARCENMNPSGVEHWEETEMGKFEKRNAKKILRGLLIAAVVATMLATTAFAYTGFVVYENPKAMLEAFFGEQPEPHGPDCLCAECTAVKPTYERESLNEEVAMEEVAPFISEIGDSFVDERMGIRYTVDAHTFDPATGCGLLYYTMERVGDKAEYPITYELEDNGEITWIGNPISLPNTAYLVAEESTATKLKIAMYYVRTGSHADETVLKFSAGAEIYDEETGEKIGEDPDCILYLPFEDGGGMKSLTMAEGKIILSPIGLVVYDEIVTEGRSGYSNELNLDYLSIKYKNGTEYLIYCDTDSLTINYANQIAEQLDEIQKTWKQTYCLNRVVDIDNVEAVIINGIEFSVE